jgi:hypothetical protein
MRGGGCAARGQENEAASLKDDRGRWMRRDKRQNNNQPGQTREVNWRRTHRLAIGRQETEEEGYFYQAVECVFDQICSFGLHVIRYVMFLCFPVQFRTKQTKCFFAYVMLNIICLCFYVFGNAPITAYGSLVRHSRQKTCLPPARLITVGLACSHINNLHRKLVLAPKLFSKFGLVIMWR